MTNNQLIKWLGTQGIDLDGCLKSLMIELEDRRVNNCLYRDSLSYLVATALAPLDRQTVDEKQMELHRRAELAELEGGAE